MTQNVILFRACKEKIFLGIRTIRSHSIIKKVSTAKLHKELSISLLHFVPFGMATKCFDKLKINSVFKKKKKFYVSAISPEKMFQSKNYCNRFPPFDTRRPVLSALLYWVEPDCPELEDWICRCFDLDRFLDLDRVRFGLDCCEYLLSGLLLM